MVELCFPIVIIAKQQNPHKGDIKEVCSETEKGTYSNVYMYRSTNVPVITDTPSSETYLQWRR